MDKFSFSTDFVCNVLSEYTAGTDAAQINIIIMISCADFSKRGQDQILTHATQSLLQGPQLWWKIADELWCIWKKWLVNS